MKRLTLCVTTLLVISAAIAEAQLAPANAAGLTFSHVHLNVADVEVHKRVWSELLSGTVVERAGYVAISVPGTLIFLSDQAPTSPSVGTAIDHVGFKVRDLESVLAKWKSWGYEVDAEFTGGEGLPQAYVTMPNGTRVELTGDTELSMPAEMHRTRGTIETTTDVPGSNLSSGPSERVAPTQLTATDHVGFEVEDIHAFAQMLESKGVEFQLAPFHVESLDIWVGFFVDPAGARIEISQGLDRFQSAGPSGGAF